MKKHYSRKFLNKDEGIAFIECYIKTEGEKTIDAGIKFGDCSRSANIDFSVYGIGNDNDSAESRLEKLNLMISEIQAFKKVFVKELNRVAKASQPQPRKVPQDAPVPAVLRSGRTSGTS